MAAKATYIVEMRLVIVNESTKDKLLGAIDQLEAIVEDYPWLDLQDPVRELAEAIEELAHEPA